jgi:transcription elongation factor Elf1
MSSGIFDDQSLPVTCPECKHDTPVKIGRLKHSPNVTCLGCGKTIEVDAKELAEGLRRAQKMVDDLGRKLGGFK